MKQILIALMTVSLLVGCATERQQRATTTGAIIGATAGAVIGSQSDRTAQGAVIGGILGGLAGAVLAGDGSDEVYASGPAYHRRPCPRGERYFVAARRARDPHRRVVLLRQGLRYCPNNPAAYNDLGVALIIIGDDVGAREHFQHALRLDPGYEPARRNLMTVERRGPRREPMPRYQQSPGRQGTPQQQRQQLRYRSSVSRQTGNSRVTSNNVSSSHRPTANNSASSQSKSVRMTAAVARERSRRTSGGTGPQVTGGTNAISVTKVMTRGRS